MPPSPQKPVRVAFVTALFPAVPGAFIVNQVADLIDRGAVVSLFAFHLGSTENVSERYHSYHMDKLAQSLDTR